MNPVKLFVAIFTITSLIFVLLGIGILVSTIGGCMLAFICAIWIYCIFLLLDSENQLYQVIAFLLTGIIGTIILIEIRSTYKKLDLHFLD